MPYIAWNPFARIREREDIAALRLPFPFGLMPANYTRYVGHITNYNERAQVTTFKNVQKAKGYS